MKQTYIESIINKGGRKIAEMHIYTHIGKGGVNAADFVKELNSFDTKDRVNVRINTVGGSVVDGFGIFSAMLNFKERGGELHTYNDGLAASTGGWLLLAADPQNIHSKDFAILMLHGVKNDVQGNLFEKSILTIFKNRSGLDVENLMTNGTDNFFDSTEASARGFFPIENIENTGFKIDIPDNCSLLEVSNSIQNIVNNINQKPLKMKTVINLLKLQDGSSEEVIAAAVQNALDLAKTNADALVLAENKVTEANAKVLELQGKVDEAVKNSATVFVEAKIKEGKFTPKNEADKEALVKQYIASPENFTALVDMMPTKASNVLDKIDESGAETKTLMDKVDNRSLRDLEKQDPALLLQIKNEAKGEFVKLWNKQYGTSKTEADFK